MLCCSSAEFSGETVWNLVHDDYMGITKGESKLAVFI